MSVEKPTILQIPTEHLARTLTFEFDPLTYPQGRIEFWKWPKPGHKYALGTDHALGMEGRDYDAGVVLDATMYPVEQVAEMHGHWGENFDRMMFAMAVYYNGAFILGERQFGLPCLRRLIDDYGYGWVYYDRSEESRSRRLTDKLGYWRGSRDICIPNFRRAVSDREIILRSPTLISQMRKLEYAPKTAAVDPEDALDIQLGVKLAGGGSPDLVMGASYAWHATGEMAHFPEPSEMYEEGTLGAILEHKKLAEAPAVDASGRVAANRKKRAKRRRKRQTG